MSTRTESGTSKPKELMGYTATLCTNCKESLGTEPKAFKGVIICVRCHKIVAHLSEKARRQYESYLLVYFETLRVALVKGQLNLPVLPSEQEMPKSELLKAMRDLGGRNEEQHKTRSDSEGPVHPLSGGAPDRHGAIPGGGRPSALRRRGDIREVSPVPERGTEGGGDSEAVGDQTPGVDGGTR